MPRAKRHPSTRVLQAPSQKEGAYLCHDCGTDTAPCTGKRGCRHKGKWETYMVWDAVWNLAGMTTGFLCIGCLEKRLGRQLCGSDFTDARINDIHPWDTPRLIARKLAW